VTAAAISYRMDGGVAERELCWFGDALFLPHLWKTLGTRGLSTEVRFQEPTFYADRRTAAERAHSEVARMREQMRDSGNSQVSAEPILSPPRAG
jgi:1-acyl-sn-glycerol-3-phosphate acyltransferase